MYEARSVVVLACDVVRCTPTHLRWGGILVVIRYAVAHRAYVDCAHRRSHCRFLPSPSSLLTPSHPQPRAATWAAGLGVFAAVPLARGDPVLRVPQSLLLTAAAALQDPVVGTPLATLRAEPEIASLLDDRVLTMLFLLHQRRLGHASDWWAYIASLPGDELVRALPMHWEEAQQYRLLRGTPLLPQALEARAALRTLFAQVVRGALCVQWPEAFPTTAYTWERLMWAHAIFWSRALSVPLRGASLFAQNTEALVPLLDLCNHRAGSTCELKAERTSDGTSDGSSAIVLHAGRSVPEGEEVFINYGAKGNAELLRCHGFAVRDNQADVCEVQLANLRPHGKLRARQHPLLP